MDSNGDSVREEVMGRVLDLFPLAVENLERDGVLVPVTMILNDDSMPFFVSGTSPALTPPPLPRGEGNGNSVPVPENSARSPTFTPTPFPREEGNSNSVPIPEIPDWRADWAVQVADALRRHKGTSYYVIAESWVGTAESGLPASEQPDRTEAVIIHGRHKSGTFITAALPFEKTGNAYKWGEVRVLEEPEAAFGVFSDLFEAVRRSVDPSLS